MQLPAYAAYNPQQEVAEDKADAAAEHRFSLSKPLALSLQKELLKVFTAPAFQRKLHELARMHNATEFKTAEYRFAFRGLVRDEQIHVIKRHGFRASEEGFRDMLRAFVEFENDADVQVNSKVINEALFTPSTPASSLEPVQILRPDKPQEVSEVMGLLRVLRDMYSLPVFQAKLADLKLAEKDARSKAGGYYHLSGRAELASSYHSSVNVLPQWGFKSSKEGLQEMVIFCAQFLHVKEVQELFYDINSKLGMSKEACQRFCRLAVDLAQLKPSIAVHASGDRGDRSFGADNRLSPEFAIVC